MVIHNTESPCWDWCQQTTTTQKNCIVVFLHIFIAMLQKNHSWHSRTLLSIMGQVLRTFNWTKTTCSCYDCNVPASLPSTVFLPLWGEKTIVLICGREKGDWQQQVISLYIELNACDYNIVHEFYGCDRCFFRSCIYPDVSASCNISSLRRQKGIPIYLKQQPVRSFCLQADDFMCRDNITLSNKVVR